MVDFIKLFLHVLDARCGSSRQLEAEITVRHHNAAASAEWLCRPALALCASSISTGDLMKLERSMIDQRCPPVWLPCE
jgi:hypothetical protein